MCILKIFLWKIRLPMRAMRNRHKLLNMIMKKLFTIILLIITLSVNGQKDTCYFKQYFSNTLTELILTDLRFSYEYRVHLKHSLTFGLGYKFPLLQYSPVDGFNFIKGNDGLNEYVHKNYNFSFGYNYFFHFRPNMKQNYFSASLLYTYKFCDNIVTVNGTDANYGYGLVSSHQYIYDYRLVFGQRILQISSDLKPPVFFAEGYIGIGIIDRNGEMIEYGYSGGYEATPKATDINFVYYPSPDVNNLNKTFLHLIIGLKFGITWNKIIKNY